MKLKDKLARQADRIFAKHGTEWKSLTNPKPTSMTEEQALALAELSSISKVSSPSFIETHLKIPICRVRSARFRTS